MITLGFLLTFIFLGQLILFIDIFLYHFSFVNAIKNLYESQNYEDRIILYITLLIGFIWAIAGDLRMKKRKAKTN